MQIAALGIGGAASLLMMLGAAAHAAAPAEIGADIILRNGKIVTVDEKFTVREAIAIRGDRILAVGSDRQMLALAGPNARIVDLKGHTVVPGMIDGHHHFLAKSVDAYLGVDIALAQSIEEVKQKIADKVARTPPGELVYTTSGWLPAQFKENRPPVAADLDPVSPNHPVVVQGGHSVYLNSYAMKQAGITRDTPSPEGGVIEKDPRTGEPTGRLMENAAHLADRWPRGRATPEEKLAALKEGQRKMNAAGLTGVREPGISPADMRVFQQLHDSGEMTLRVSMNYSLDPSLSIEQLTTQLQTWGVSTGFGDHMLRLDGIGEFGIDGGFEGALMSEHYAIAPGHEKAEEYFGLQRIPTEKFDQAIALMNRLNWRATIHTAGDKALDLVLDAYEKANREQPLARKRWTVEHLLYTRPDQYRRIKDLGLVVSTQFHGYMAGQDMINFWGEQRAAGSTAVRDWLDAGLLVGGGSDWSLLPADPFWMMYFFVTRDTRLWGVMGPKQRVTRPEALRMMTINNAYITMEEDAKGSLEPGKLADLVVLSKDYLSVPEAQIKDIEVLATMVGGKVVFQRPAAAVTLQ
ncbi:amidohydrolase [Steroidobacter cummioxidans]|uniref:amidohydrolase n=1 Tax=Steroidobacter cummioxidans TaxID=1803913 RepID=UPI000E30D7E9|nr:amidohydrolase [Steroidobacter cummioxidans]